MAALEYFNGSSWVTLSNVSPTTLTGAVTGTGTGTIATTLNSVQTVSGSGNFQYFNFNAYSSLFQLTNLFSSAGGVTAYNNFTMLTDTKDFNFKHTLSPAASTSLYDNGTFGLYTHNNTTGAASLIFSTSYNNTLFAYTSAFSTNVGVGTLTPTQASLVVSGGVENVTGEDSCIRAISNNVVTKIEIQNTNVLGKIYELRSYSNGTFGIGSSTTGWPPSIQIDSDGNVLFGALKTYFGRRPSGVITMQGNTTGTTITSGSNFYKVAGATSSYNLNLFTASSNRLTFVSPYAAYVTVRVSLNASHNSIATDEIKFAIFANGSGLGVSVVSGQGANNTILSYSLDATIFMSSNDYIEVWCTHPTSGAIITVKNMIISVSTT